MKILIQLTLLLVIGVNSLSLANNNNKSDEANSNYDNLTLENLLVQHKGYVRIEIEKMLTGHLLLEVELNGVKGKFILDTGASTTVLESNRKDKFNLMIESTDEEAAGAGGAGMQMETSDGNNLKIGDTEFDNFQIYLMSLDHVNQAFSSYGVEEVDGVIGADVLTFKDGIIDYSNLVLYLKR